MSQLDDLKTLAGVIKNESTARANTATRIGTWLLELIAFIEDEDNGFARTEDIPSVAGLVNGSTVSQMIAGALAAYVMKSELNQTVATLCTKEELNSTKNTLYNKTQVNAMIQAVKTQSQTYADNLVSALSASIATAYAKKADLPSLEGYAKLTDIPSLAEYAKKSELPNLSEYAKLTDIPSLDEYAKTEDIPSLDGYAKTTDIPDTSGLATKTSVNTVASKQTTMESQITNLGVKAVTDDADTLTLTARYLMNTGSTNVPFTPCYMEVLAASTSFIVQEVVSNSGVKKTRVYNGSAWSTWA